MIDQLYKDSVIQIRINKSEKGTWESYYMEQEFDSLSEFIRVCVNYMIVKGLKYNSLKKQIKLKKDALIRFKIGSESKANWMIYAKNNNFSSVSKLIRYSLNEYIKNAESYGKLNKEVSLHHITYKKYDNHIENLFAINNRVPFKKYEKEGTPFKLNNTTHDMIETIKELYLESEKESNMLKKIIIKKLPPMNMVSLNKTIITISTTNYFEELNSINISFAIAYISKNGKATPKYLSEISIIPFQNPLLIIFILQETLKYRLILDILNEKEYKTRNPELILIEGTITSLQENVFESLKNENEVIRKYIEIFIETTNEFFNIAKERNIHVIALDKKNTGTKYFNSLSNHIDNDFIKLNNQDGKLLLNIESKTILKNWRRKNITRNITGELASYYVFRNLEGFYRTLALPLSKGFGFQTDLIVNNLREGNLLGLFINSSESHTFYLETPLYLEERIEEILKLFIIMCYNSIIPGFPMPLYLTKAYIKRLSENLANTLAYLERKPLAYKFMKSEKNEIIEYMNDFIAILNERSIDGVSS